MRILLTFAHFGIGGTESYSVTVAEQLERLGHRTDLHTATATPEGQELAAQRGLRLSVGEDPPGRDDLDAVVAQDLASAYLLAARPGLRRLFVIHGLQPFEQPPGPAGAASPVVVLSDRMRDWVRARSPRSETVRLRQPIDITRFRPLAATRPRARRLLVLSNSLAGDRVRLLEGACKDLGLELTRIGGVGRISTAPREAIAAADIVVGYGRSVLEAMAMGKPAYVWERGGGDGWVTPDTYSELEANGFSGGATDSVIDGERLRTDLAAYDPELGIFGYDLVRNHHLATQHAEALVDLLEKAGEGPPAAANEEMLEALALLVRTQRRTALDVARLEDECVRRLEAIDGERETRLAAEAHLAALVESRSWRLTSPLRRLGARLGRG